MVEIKITVNSVYEVRTIKTALETLKDSLQEELLKSNYNYGEVKRITDNEIKRIDGLLEMLKEF